MRARLLARRLDAAGGDAAATLLPACAEPLRVLFPDGERNAAIVARADIDALIAAGIAAGNLRSTARGCWRMRRWARRTARSSPARCSPTRRSPGASARSAPPRKRPTATSGTLVCIDPSASASGHLAAVASRRRAIRHARTQIPDQPDRFAYILNAAPGCRPESKSHPLPNFRADQSHPYTVTRRWPDPRAYDATRRLQR